MIVFLQEEFLKMSTSIKSTIAEQGKEYSLLDSLSDAVTVLKQVASDMSKTIGEATTATTQITDTAHNYKQALMQAAPQALHTQT